MRALLAAGVLLVSAPGPAAAADLWGDLVAASATREQVVKALGKPEIEFTAFVEKGETPLQISPSLPPPPLPGEVPDFRDDDLLRVLEYRGRKRGLNYQVVLKDEKVWYCVAPPLADEQDLGAVRKKHGKVAAKRVDVLTADLLRTWDLVRYPKKKRAFVTEPGTEPVLARIVTR